MATIINSKIGIHKEKRRVYLQGRKLARQGVEPGQHFNVIEQGDNLILEINPNGKYKVSRRQSNGELLPVIDLRVDEIAKLFEGVDTIRAAVKAGKIVISAHHQHTKIKAREARLAEKLATGKPLDCCSLFHGGGVVDKAIHAGLKSAGVKSRIAVAVEIESNYLESSLANNPELFDDDSIVIESPVQMVNLKNAPEVDVVVAGIPCTGASKSGRSKGKLEFAESHSEAGALFFSFLQVVQVLNPALVIMENVSEYANTSSWVVIRSVLASLGYTLQETVLNGNEFGALENRNRLCAVAVSNGIAVGDIKGITPVREKEACLNDVLEPIALDDARWKSFDYLAKKEARDKAAGKGFSRQLLTGLEAFCGTIGRGYAKCRSTEPFLMHPLIESLSRILTPVEHARVKGIPESVVNGLSDTIAHEVLGQSVIYPVFEAVAKWLGLELCAAHSQTAMAA